MTNDFQSSKCVWCLAAMLLGVGCGDDSAVDRSEDAGPTTELDAGPTPPDAAVDARAPTPGDAAADMRDAELTEDRDYSFVVDGDAISIEADLSDEVRDSFPGAATQRVDINTADDTVLMRLLNAEGEPIQLFALDLEEARDGSRTVEVEFPAEVPTTCCAVRCFWDFDAAPDVGDPATGAPAGDHLVFTETARTVTTVGVVGGVSVTTEALFGPDGELADLRRTADQAPSDWTGEVTLAGVGAMMNDLQELLDFTAMNEPQAASLGCKFGQVAGWVVTGAAVAGCCAVGNVPGCVICGGLGGGVAGLIGELC
ncbi:MAG: hypothetical protein AAF645_14565 [Myxococcota bacterium]